MTELEEETRARIRHLYFVDRVALDTIARTLSVSRGTVQQALVLRGGADRLPLARRSPR